MTLSRIGLAGASLLALTAAPAFAQVTPPQAGQTPGALGASTPSPVAQTYGAQTYGAQPSPSATTSPDAAAYGAPTGSAQADPMSTQTMSQDMNAPSARPAADPAFAATAGSAVRANLRQLPWTGGYVGIVGGSTLRRDGAVPRVGFDTNLDGTFNDTVNTALGENAFLGFCSGRPYQAEFAAGCRENRDSGEAALRFGVDWQGSALVLGLVGEVGNSGLKEETTAFSSTPASYTFKRTLQGVAGLRGRVGIAAGGGLLYATGGGAGARVKESFRTSNASNAFSPVRETNTAWGWQYGGGIEARASERVSLGLEWLRTELDLDESLAVRASGGAPGSPFTLTNANGTDLRRTATEWEFDSVRVTMGLRF